MRGEKSRRGRRSTTKKGRTAVWDIGRRRSLLHRWGRLSPATLCWLRRPQPQTRSRKVSYDLVREERGQVTTISTVMTSIMPMPITRGQKGGSLSKNRKSSLSYLSGALRWSISLLLVLIKERRSTEPIYSPYPPTSSPDSVGSVV